MDVAEQWTEKYWHCFTVECVYHRSLRSKNHKNQSKICRRSIRIRIVWPKGNHVDYWSMETRCSVSGLHTLCMHISPLHNWISSIDHLNSTAQRSTDVLYPFYVTISLAPAGFCFFVLFNVVCACVYIVYVCFVLFSPRLLRWEIPMVCRDNASKQSRTNGRTIERGKNSEFDEEHKSNQNLYSWCGMHLIAQL